jgi:hypothetical protein
MADAAWQDRLRAGLAELLRFIVEKPEDARMVIVEARASSASGRRRRNELLERFACIGSLANERAEGKCFADRRGRSRIGPLHPCAKG